MLAPVWLPTLGVLWFAFVVAALLFCFRRKVPGWKFVKAYLTFLAPFYGIITIVFAAFFSFWWSLAIGACLFIHGEVLLDRAWGGNAARWPAVVAAFDAIVRPVFDYFPISLHKTAELPPERHYIFGYHPHGIYAFGAFSLVFQSTSGFENLFSRSCGVLVGVASALLHL